MEKRQMQVCDRISALPDALLCHILSFLPTIYAVRTTVLSPRWKNVWTSISNLHIQDGDLSSHAALSRFVRRIFTFRGSSDIRKLSVRCVHYKRFSLISRWVDTAIRHNVVELELSISSCPSDSRTFELPQSLLMCKSLVVLKLWSNFIINTPTSSGRFPALKSLNVSFDSPDNYSIEKLFSHFPVLEDLTIKAIFPLYGPTEDLNVNILAPKLKRLKVVLHVHSDLQCAFHIDAPNLENLHLKGPVLSSFSLEKAQSLVKAVLNNRNSRELLNRGTPLLERISNVKSLYLEALGLEACCLPHFDNLKQLKLLLQDCYFGRLLIELLKSSPNLEFLDMECVSKMYMQQARYLFAAFKYSQAYTNYEELDLRSECVPSCLLSNLKTVSISGYCGMRDKMEIAKYILHNGEGLNKMTIRTNSILDLDEKEALHKEILIVQIASKTCQVEFIPGLIHIP